MPQASDTSLVKTKTVAQDNDLERAFREVSKRLEPFKTSKYIQRCLVGHWPVLEVGNRRKGCLRFRPSH